MSQTVTSALKPGVVTLVTFPVKGDDRGSLIAFEACGDTVPFNIQRVYTIFGTTPGVVRGKHAHKNLEQVLIATSGSCVIHTDTASNQRQTLLDSPDKGLYLNGGVWREMSDFTPDCVLMVLASHHYDPDDYIWDYKTFLAHYTDIANYADLANYTDLAQDGG